MQALSIACATVLVLNQTQLNILKYAQIGDISLLTVWDELALGINVMLSYRAFKRALTAPMLFQIEVFVALMLIDALKDE